MAVRLNVGATILHHILIQVILVSPSGAVRCYTDLDKTKVIYCQQTLSSIIIGYADNEQMSYTQLKNSCKLSTFVKGLGQEA